MADFNTHVLGATGVGSLVATVGHKVELLSIEQALMVTLATVLGGVLPDVDLKSSTPGKALFTIIGVALAAAWLFARLPDMTVVEAWAGAIAIYLALRYPAWWLFHQFTVHRGSLHSLAAVLMSGFGAAAVSHRMLDLDPVSSWANGLALALGYLVHLVLDELYSVDFLGARIHRSFGSALKPVDTERLFGSAMVLLTALLLWFLTPEGGPFVDALPSRDLDWRAILAPREFR